MPKFFLIFVAVLLVMLVAMAVAVLLRKRKASSPARMEYETILELIRRQNEIDSELVKMTETVCKLAKMMENR